MNLKDHIGELVMTTDPGHKMVRSMPAHGPYKLLAVTKAGLAILEGLEDFRIAPRNSILIRKPSE